MKPRWDFPVFAPFGPVQQREVPSKVFGGAFEFTSWTFQNLLRW
jgi:hypothetical protein